MPVTRLDHFTVLTTNAETTADFYGAILDLQAGPRPNLGVDGVWLYCGGIAVLHVIEKTAVPEGASVIDHVAFCGTDLADIVGRLSAHGVAYRLQRLPAGAADAGDWQLFFHDPNGARIEVGFPADEPDPRRV